MIENLAKWFHAPIGWTRLVLVLAATGGAAALLVAGIDDRIVHHQCTTYVKVPCYIEDCSFSKEKGLDNRNLPGHHYVPLVSYRYEVEGVTYTGQRICSRTTPITTVFAAEAFQTKYGPGQNAECWVNPNDPESAMLELPTNSGSIYFAKLGGMILGFALIGLAVLQYGLSLDTALPRPTARAPGWGAIDSGPGDPLKRTREMLRERLES